MVRILVVDDQKTLRKNLAFYLKSQEFEVDTAESGEEALDLIRNTVYDVIVSDYKMRELNGYDLLKHVRRVQPTAAFIMVTAYGNIPLAVEAIREGAADYIPKPFEYSAILEKIKAILKRRESAVGADPERSRMICHSQKMKDIQDLAFKASTSEITILIQGEHGVGKRLFATVVHNLGSRSQGEFVAVECSNSSEAVLERELFGADDEGEIGALGKASGGTIFMKDIDCLSANLQLRILRFITEGSYMPVNSSSLRRSDARIITATTLDLSKMVNDGSFRKDLYYRLNVMPVFIPPLRSRISDLDSLIDHILARQNALLKKNITGISQEARSWMESYNWPGNVQELENILARACTLATGDVLDESLIFTLPQDRPLQDEPQGYLNMTLKDNQKTLILRTLKQNNNNYSRTAAQLGISRTTLWRRMKKFRIEGIEVGK
jgi:DNA-binding NtrC family response regulator